MKKQSTEKEVHDIIGGIQKGLFDLDNELKQISVDGIPRDNTMKVGPSMMFDDIETAQQALGNPDVEFAIQYVKDVVAKNMKQNNV